MASEWIKMRASLTTHPKVTVIAKMLESHLSVGKRLATGHAGAMRDIVTRDVTRDVTLASLFRVWCAANEHTSDGVWRGIEISDLDHIAGIPCFGEMMQSVGWAIFDAASMTVTFPNFLEYNAPAKERKSGSAERQRRYRDRQRNASDVTRDVTRDVTSHATGDVEKIREEVEKIREEEKREAPDSDGSGEVGETDAKYVSPYSLDFLNFWLAFPAGRKKSKGAAWESWKKAIRKVDVETLLVKASEYAMSPEGQGDHVKMPSTWLNQRCWEDEPEAWLAKNSTAGGSGNGRLLAHTGPGHRFREETDV